MIEILSCVLQNDIYIILTQSSFKFENDVNDSNLSNLISDLAVLLHQISNKTTKKAFTTNFELNLISYKIEKFD